MISWMVPEADSNELQSVIQILDKFPNNWAVGTVHK